MELADLERDLRRLKDQIARKNGMLNDEVEMWELGLQGGGWETYMQVKRRISRLKGARDCRGLSD